MTLKKTYLLCLSILMCSVTSNIHDNTKTLNHDADFRSKIEQQAIIVFELKENQHNSVKSSALNSFSNVKKQNIHNKLTQKTFVSVSQRQQNITDPIPYITKKVVNLKSIKKNKSNRKTYRTDYSFHKAYKKGRLFHIDYSGVQLPFNKSDTTINKNSSKTKPKATLNPKKSLVLQSDISADKTNKITKLSNDNKVDYWDTVHSIESKQGKLLYRPRNKARNCSYTTGPCGHHQLTVQALKDIGCKSMQCRKDRLDFKKSLELSKKLLALNEKRLKKHGLTNLEDHQKYLIHQQGANGIKNIIAASKGKKELSKTIKKNMANNSPYSYRQLKNMGSKNAANKFMKHWERKWGKEQRLVLASISKNTNRQINPIAIPSFSDSELNFALNMKF